MSSPLSSGDRALGKQKLITYLDEPPAEPTPAPGPKGIDAFPSLDEPSGDSEFRVTGASGTGDVERAEFENAFPDLTSEVPYEAVCCFQFLFHYKEAASASGV